MNLDKSDFVMIGDVAKHCDLPKLNIAINEAIEFDMKPKLCGLFELVKTNWSQAEGVYKDIVEPKTFEDCKGNTVGHLGLKNSLAYFAYSRYVMINGFSDTANGVVQKTNNFSVPTPLKELKSFANKYENIANSIFSDVERYMFKNKDSYTAYDFKDFSCGCGGSCSSKASTKRQRFKVSSVGKY